ncbi:GNAT family N-acetyltransferase [Rhizobium sp. C4]|uniref:GNAT family N-acetyltransferase n=1 Tax=Rhizobium sp. C4 TaxID=1349800 RepID=UPI001E3159AF|nr:GNAT family N-acetyltransferase [Rhizobium sp. C4]MCD2174471.1 GNAT family N-acetyltransferase [Rhizobium sp. C4]
MTERQAQFRSPEPLTAAHMLDGFQSGEPVLDEWLIKRARANAALGASRTFVCLSSGATVVAGYYALSMGQVLNRDATGAMRRNMPQHIPAVILGRLAVDLRFQGHGLGTALLKDAVLRSLRAINEVSARLIVVHAISPAAEAFYRRHGFVRLPVETPTYALDLVKFAGEVGG